jgi:hypothetical protein
VAQRPSLGQVQIRQHVPGALCYRVKAGPNFGGREDIEYLTRATRRHLGTQTRVDVELVNELPCEASGKFLFCRSDVAPDFVRGRSPLSQGSGSCVES